MSPKAILGIIPARGGSKGIPRKNIVDVCGKPLISYSIECGNELVRVGSLSRCVVSTDDEEIAEIARRQGGEVPFMRPASLATDSAESIGFILHALDTFAARGERYWAAMLLQPTSPIRATVEVQQAAERFSTGTANSLISCYQEDYVNDLVMYHDDGDGYLKPKNLMHNKGVRRQDHGSIYVRNGALYITRVDYLRRTGQIVCDRPMLMRMSKSASIDVDTPEDLAILRAVLCA